MDVCRDDSEHQSKTQGPMNQQVPVAIDIAGVERVEVNGVCIISQGREVEKMK